MTDEDLMTSNMSDDNITITSGSSANYTFSNLPTMNYNYTITTAPNTAIGSQFINNGGSLTFGNTYHDSALEVKGDANFEGDVKIKGKSIIEMLEKIESRLAILQPDPEKLEKYEALRKAYEHYKTLERLIGED